MISTFLPWIPPRPADPHTICGLKKALLHQGRNRTIGDIVRAPYRCSAGALVCFKKPFPRAVLHTWNALYYRYDGTVSVQVLIQMFNSYFGMIRGTGSTWFVRSEKIRHISSMGKATVTASNDFISFKTGCPREVLLRPCPSPSKILRP